MAGLSINRKAHRAKGPLTIQPSTVKTSKFDNQKARSVAERLAEMGCDPFEIVARVAMGDVVKMGAMSAQELNSPGAYDKQGRCIQSSGRQISFEYIPMVLRVKAASELLQYVSPKLQATTIANPDGSKVDIVAVQLYLPDNGRSK